jgi:hypothetical protein
MFSQTESNITRLKTGFSRWAFNWKNRRGSALPDEAFYHSGRARRAKA